MKGEILSMETTQYIQELKNTIESQSDIILELEEKIRKANDFILSHAKEYKPHFAKVELNTTDCSKLLNILEGKDEKSNIK